MPRASVSGAPTVPSRRPTQWPLCLAVLAAACTADAARPEEARIGFVLYGERAVESLRGAQFGAEEAAHAGRLVDRTLVLLAERADAPDQVAGAARRLLDRGVFAIVGGFDEPSCRTLGKLAEQHAVLFLNVGCRSDALRSARFGNTFHVEASEAMYSAPDFPAGLGAVLWDAGLTRYGAAQLNERFRRRFGSPLGPSEWAGWMAVKVLWESLLRTGTTDARALGAFLRADSTRLDGHKGGPLGFTAATHQLLQPLYPLRVERGSSGDRVRAPPTHHASLPELDGAALHDGEYLFVSNEGSGDVTVVDLRSGVSVARIPVAQRPRGIHVGPAGTRLYVALSDEAPTVQSDADAVAVIDLRLGREIGRLAAGSDPEQFGITPDGTRLYASNEDAGTTTAIALDSGSVLGTAVVGIEPEGVAVSPDGRWVYVTAETSNTVSVIDTRSDEVVASFLVDVRPRGVAFSPTLPRAYVTNEISGTLSVVDTRAHRVVATIPLGGSAKPVGVVVSPDGSRVYVANGHEHSVSVIDAAAERVVARVRVGRRPWGIAITSDGSRLYTANGGSDDVSVIDASTLRVIRTIPVGERPWGVAIRPGA
jgi:PQQ-dependent catabolism-associated beta-propeller protein